MQLPIHIDRPGACVHDAAAIRAALADSAFPLPGAAVRYWAASGWQVLEQGYDLPNVYVGYMEITATDGTTVPIRCPLHNLYGFYVLEGDVGIAAAHGKAMVLRTGAGHYRLSYLPAAAYHCRIARGTHRIFYFVASDAVLFREPSPELEAAIGPVDALRAKLGKPMVSARLPLAGEASHAIGRFLHRPGSTYLRRYIAIQQLAITLLLEACEALRIRSATGQVGEAFARRICTYIDEQVIEGHPVDVASVAHRFTVSYAYAKQTFRRYTGQPIGAYIRTCKLEQARRMLEAGEGPAQVACYLCWSYGHFSKAFKARYGVPPKAYK